MFMKFSEFRKAAPKRQAEYKNGVKAEGFENTPLCRYMRQALPC